MSKQEMPEPQPPGVALQAPPPEQGESVEQIEAPPVIPEWRLPRPRKLTPEVAERIITSMIAGLPLNQAARAAGIAPKTLDEWLAKGRAQARGILHDFAQAVDDQAISSKILR